MSHDDIDPTRAPDTTPPGKTSNPEPDPERIPGSDKPLKEDRDRMDDPGRNRNPGQRPGNQPHKTPHEPGRT